MALRDRYWRLLPFRHWTVNDSDQPEAALNHPMSVWQRLLTVDATGLTQAFCQKASVG
jgi:hypothetical protein